MRTYSTKQESGPVGVPLGSSRSASKTRVLLLKDSKHSVVVRPVKSNLIALALLVVALAWLAGTETSANTYSIIFSTDENPISAGGLWINGRSQGIDWSDVATTNGLAYGLQADGGYDDSTALLTGVWGPDQTATA